LTPLELVVLSEAGRSEEAVCGGFCEEGVETREVRELPKLLFRLDRENSFCMLIDLRRPLLAGPLGTGSWEPKLSWRWLSWCDIGWTLLRSSLDDVSWLVNWYANGRWCNWEELPAKEFVSCRFRESVEGEADFERLKSGVEKLAGCFLGKEVELLLGDPNGSDHVLADTFLLWLDWQLLLCCSLLLLPLLLLL
jgi:hypothetical protein